MTVDPQVLEQYHKMRKPHLGINDRGMWAQYVKARDALKAAHNALSDQETRAKFENIGAVYYQVGESIKDGLQKEYGSDYPYVRLLLVPDYDGYATVLDFDCCPDPATGSPDTGARWRKCDCVVSRNPADVQTARENERVCAYGQPCKHKCDEARRIECEGTYGLVSEYRTAEGEWEQADSCWGFVDDDWKDSGYAEDAMREAMRMLTVGQYC